MVKVLDYSIEVGKFELKSRFYAYFWTNSLGKGMNPLSPLQLWVKQYHGCSFYKDAFDIK